MNGESEQLRWIIREELRVFNDEVFLPSFGKYTEEVVLPAIETAKEDLEKKFNERIDSVESGLIGVNNRIGKLQSDAIDFITRQINDAKGEIIRAIREERERDKLFKRTIVEILQRHNLADAGELDFLRGLLDAKA